MNRNTYILLSIMATVFLITSCKVSRYQVEEFEPRIRQNPSDADKDFNEGYALYLLNRQQESADALARAVEGNPTDGQAYFFLGMAYASLQKRDESKNAFDKAFSLGDEYGATREQMAKVYRVRGDREKEIEVLKEAIANNEPHPVILHYYLGIAYIAEDRQEDAILAFTKGISLSPSSSASYGSYFYLGLIYLDLKKYDDAIQVLEQQIKINPEYSKIIETYFRLGIAYHLNTEYQRAIPLYEKVLSQIPDHIITSYNLATAYWLTGQREKSLAISEKIERIDQTRASSLKAFFENNPNPQGNK